MLGPSDLKQIDQAIQAGRGAAASVLGQTYNVYRLSSAAQAGILTTTPVIVGYQAYLAKASKAKIENDTLELEVAQWTCDVTNLILGDVLVETGYKSEGSSWCFSQARPRRESLFVRVELAAKIYRPRIGNIIPAGTAAASPGAPFVSPSRSSTASTLSARRRPIRRQRSPSVSSSRREPAERAERIHFPDRPRLRGSSGTSRHSALR
jgi:hypothetical protein